ncbi:MAG: glucose-1-phosphate adenylyltransferase, partial [Lacisediminimonas sp.]|nr:glucose-1-phosphate adenylyltransferase [Lacisediminimonas sp.]
SNVRIHSYCKIVQAVILPQSVIGKHCRLKGVVVDRGCTIPDGTVIGEDAQADAARFYRSDNGVVLVTSEMLERLARA